MPRCAARILFAYEPVWAIGENGIPGKRRLCRQAAGVDQAGGRGAIGIHRPLPSTAEASTPRTPPELVAQPNIDGLFVGRAAWQAEGYIRMLGIVSAAL